MNIEVIKSAWRRLRRPSLNTISQLESCCAKIDYWPHYEPRDSRARKVIRGTAFNTSGHRPVSIVKELAAAIMALSIAANSMSAEQRTANPQIAFVAATADSIIVQVTAGSEGAPLGFDVIWRSDSSKGCRAAFNCGPYILAPLQSVNVSLPVTPSECRFSSCIDPLTCGTSYEIRAGMLNGRATRPITASTGSCQ